MDKFSGDLAGKTRWLVIHPPALLLADELAERRDSLLKKLDWQGPVFEVSAISGSGTEALGMEVMRELDEMAQAEAEADAGDDEIRP